jgi:DNA-binding GntR family transcriptional regulator
VRAPGARAGFDAYVAENRAFHAAILAASGNAQLAAIHDRLQLSLLLSQIRFAIGPEVIATSISEHRAIAEAILAGDAVAAEAAIRAHLCRATEMMRAVPIDSFRPDSRRPPEVVPPVV